jgi:hypothetical protein
VRSEIAAADRRFEVRRAVAAWRKAGLVTPAAEAGMAADYADDRVRTSRIFRVLFFAFTWFGFSTAYGFGLAFFAAAGMDWEGPGFAVLNLAAGAAMLVGAEVLTGARRLRRFGIEEACAWIGASYLLGGGLWLLARGFAVESELLLTAGAWAAAVLATLAAWRWATPGMGLVAALALFVALSQLPANHLLWLLAGLVLAFPLATLSVAAHISPGHRRRFGEAFVGVVGMFYFAVHIVVVEERLFAKMKAGGAGLFASSGTQSGGLATASLVAMVLTPLVLLVAGLRRRFRPALDLGLLLGGATIATLVARSELRPAWLVFLLAGAGLLGSAIAARRFFSRREGAEWRGLTVLVVAEDRESGETLEVAAALAAFSPAARQDGPKGFEGAGGEFGGGGASAKF